MSSSQAVPDHYRTLGVPRNASRAEIRTARNRLLHQHHPDVNPDNPELNKERTVAILLAAKVLLDDEARREYDRHYEYVHGRARGTSGPAAEGRSGTVCDACGRPSQWKRAYCIYCGAPRKNPSTSSEPGANAARHSGPVNAQTEDFRYDFLREPPRKPRSFSEKGIHLGCGMLFGLGFAIGIGWRFAIASGFENGYSVAIISAAWVVGIGAMAVTLGERFWTHIRVTFGVLALVMFVLLPVALYVRRWTGDDGRALAALSLILLAGGAGIAHAARRRPDVFSWLWKSRD